MTNKKAKTYILASVIIMSVIILLLSISFILSITPGEISSNKELNDTDMGGILDTSDAFGASAEGIDDFDGDGIDDLLVGADNDDDGGANRGAVYLIYMYANGSVKNYSKINDTSIGGEGMNYSNFGSSVDDIGDLDDDGVVDFVVGADNTFDGHDDAGAVWILFMYANGTVKNYTKINDTTMDGKLHAAHYFGSAVAGVGDLDSDGVEDIAVGSDGDDDGGNYKGAVWILFMNTNGSIKSYEKINSTTIVELQTLDFFGESVSDIGDLDDDGVVDLIVGAHGDDDGGNGAGSAYILFMNTNGSVKDYTKINDTSLNGELAAIIASYGEALNFGKSADGLGDLDGDNVEDVIVGMPNYGRVDYNYEGSAYILFLYANGSVKNWSFLNNTDFDNQFDIEIEYGTSVTSLGDLNGDGVTDIAGGAYNEGAGPEGALWLSFLEGYGMAVISPTANQIFTEDEPTTVFNMTNHTAFDVCYAQLDNAANYSLTYNNDNTWNWTNVTMVDGAHNVTFICNTSSAGTWTSSESYDFEVDPINITVCRNLNVNRTYTLTNNLTASYNTATACLEVRNDSIIVDGQDLYNITVTETGAVTAIDIRINNNYDNITIKNIDLYSGGGTVNGITLVNDNHNITLDNVFIDSTNYGIEIQDNVGLTIKNSTLNDFIEANGWSGGDANDGLIIENSVISVSNAIAVDIGITGGTPYHLNITNSTLKGATRSLAIADTDASDIYIINTNLSGSSSEDVYYNNDDEGVVGNVYYINTTFDDIVYDTGADSVSWVKWYFEVQVNETDGSPISGANVTTYNNTNNIVFTAQTDANGQITRQELIEYDYDGTTKTFHTNHTINITKDSFNTNSTVYNITSEQNIVHSVILEGNSPPGIVINTPTNNTNSTDNTLDVNYTATVTGSALDTCWYSNDTMAANTTLASCTTNITTVTWTEGQHNVTVWVNDTDNNVNSTSVTFIIDTINPDIAIASPSNATNTTNNNLNINYTVSDTRLESCWYSNGTLTKNTTIACGTNITDITWKDGTDTVYIWANDSHGNVNSTQVTFTIDTTAPTVAIIHPADFQSFSTNTIDLNYTASDATMGLDTCWYANNTDANITIACGTNTTISQATDGTYTALVCANDTLGNEACDSHTWSISTTAPAVSHVAPAEAEWFATNTIEFNFTASDTDGVDTCELWGNWTGTWHKNETITKLNVETADVFSVVVGSVTAGTIADTRTEDAINHTVQETTGTPGTDFYYNFTGVNKEFDRVYIKSRYEGNDGHNIDLQLYNYSSGSWVDFIDFPNEAVLTNHTATISNYSEFVSGGIVQARIYHSTAGSAAHYVYVDYLDIYKDMGTSIAAEDGWFNKTIADGYYKWGVWCNDTNNNGAWTGVNRTFNVDTTFPTINVTYPINTTYTTTLLSINYTYSDLNTDSCWWTNDTGATNNSITCGNNVTYTASQGSTQVFVYMNDSANNINNSNVTFFVDSINPSVDITAAFTNGSVINYNTSIIFNFTITDTNLDSCWYELDANGTNVSLACGNNLTINLSEGLHTVCTSANDTLNNLNNSECYSVIPDLTYPEMSVNTTTTTGSQTVTVIPAGTDNNIDSCWYTVTNSTGQVDANNPANSSIACTGSSLITVSNLGEFNITVYVNDSAGWENSSQTTFSISALGGGAGGGGGTTITETEVIEVAKNETWCGDNVCQSAGNDLGVIEDFFTCSQDCPGFNVDSAAFYCWDDDPNTLCIWEQDIAQYIGLFLGLLLAILLFTTVEDKKTKKQIPLVKYYYLRATGQRKR